MSKWTETLGNRKASAPRIGVVHSSTSPDVHETQYSKRVRPALLESGAEYVELDFYTIDFDQFRTNGVLDTVAVDRFILGWLAAKQVDGLFFPGNYYNMVSPNINPNTARIDLEESLIRISRNYGIPVFGVCGGAQHYAHFWGAEITPDVETLTGYSHVGQSIAETSHDNIIIDAHSIYYGAYKKANLTSSAYNEDTKEVEIRVAVNSLHRQGIVYSEETVANLKKAGLRPVALDQSKKIIEGIESIAGAPVVLVQDHPEGFKNNPLIRAFVQATQAYIAKKAVIAEGNAVTENITFLQEIIAERQSLVSSSFVAQLNKEFMCNREVSVM